MSLKRLFHNGAQAPIIITKTTPSFDGAVGAMLPGKSNRADIIIKVVNRMTSYETIMVLLTFALVLINALTLKK